MGQFDKPFSLVIRMTAVAEALNSACTKPEGDEVNVNIVNSLKKYTRELTNIRNGYGVSICFDMATEELIKAVDSDRETVETMSRLARKYRAERPSAIRSSPRLWPCLLSCDTARPKGPMPLTRALTKHKRTEPWNIDLENYGSTFANLEENVAKLLDLFQRTDVSDNIRNGRYRLGEDMNGKPIVVGNE